MGSKVRLNNKLFMFYALASIAEGLLAIVWISSIPSDPKNALSIGLSMRRLILLGVIGVGVLSIVTILFTSFRYKLLNDLIFDWIQKRKLMRISQLLGFTLLLINLVPIAEWGKWGDIFERVRPIITWISLVTLQWALLCLIGTKGFVLELKSWFIRRIVPSRYAIVFTVVILLIVYILSVLLYPQGILEDYWYETGVPVLGWQIIFCGLLGLIYNHFEKQIIERLGTKTDIIVFFLIFIACGLLWGLCPLTQGYFNPGPYPPNNIFYPYSDAAIFDLQAQSTLLGLGFDSGSPLDRPIYPLFLAIIHLISGQIFTQNMILQAGLYGIFPAIVYLICVEMGSRTWGVLTASSICLWGYNAILANSLLNTSDPKQILTDFPLAIMLSLVLYVTIRWLKSGTTSGFYACVTGGMLAAAVYVRYNGLVLLPILLIIALIKHRPSYKKGLLEAWLIMVGFLAFTTPWYTRNILAGQEIKIPFSNKVIFIINQRYQPAESNSTKWIPTPVVKDSIKIQPTLITAVDDPGDFGSPKNSSNSQLSQPFINWFPPHLIHNFMSSILILPTSLEMASLRTSLDLGGEIWKPDWNGVLAPGRLIILFVQFFILSAGLTGLFRRNKICTALVILIFVGIQTANAFGRTSGGRYIVPVDWLVIIVYFAGFLYLSGKLDPIEKTEDDKEISIIFGWKQLVITLLSILLIATIPVIYERISIALFQPEEKILTIEELGSQPGIIISSQELYDIGQFLSKKHTRLLQGNAFYPTQQNIKKMNLPLVFQSMDKKVLLSFYLVQSGGYLNVYFPYKKKVDIQNQDNVILIGCKNNEWIFVRNMIIVKPDHANFLKSDFAFEKCDQFVGRK